MFVLLRDVSAAKQVIATLLAIALVLWASGAFNIGSAQAANITEVSDTLSDSAPNASSTHTVVFTSPTGIANGSYATVTLPTAANEFSGLSQITAADISFNIQALGDQTVAGNCAAADNIGFTVSGSDLVFEFCSGDGAVVAANGTTTIVIGSDAGNRITNPSPADGNQSYEIDISAGASDSGHTRVVILDTVLVTATVDTVFEFTVEGNGATEAVNGTSTTLVSSSTTIPFGTLTAWEIETLSQDLIVQTNAANGFVVTVETDGPFESSTGADIDYFDDGSTSTIPAAWSSPANTLDQEDTYGHWGVTSEDATTTRDLADEFGSNEWVGIGTAPVVVFSHDGPSDGATPGKGSTTVGYQVEISPLQEAGDDYQTVLTYIATPTF